MKHLTSLSTVLIVVGTIAACSSGATVPDAPVPAAQSGTPGAPTTGAWTNPIDGAIYAQVPAGEFTMGNGDSDPYALAKEKPQQTLNLAEFWMMKTEVTYAEYAACVKAGACTAPASARWQESAYGNYPVDNITWLQANDYAKWVGGRLPTEAEWEKAARGTDGRIYPWGNDPPTNELANYGNTVGDTSPVGQYPEGASPYGLLDMAGNAWEWTSSVFKPYPYTTEDGREDPASELSRTMRGGSFSYDADVIRSAYRVGHMQRSGSAGLGFRVVVPKPPQ